MSFLEFPVVEVLARSIFPLLILAVGWQQRRIPRRLLVIEFVCLGTLSLFSPSMLWCPFCIAYGFFFSIDYAFYSRLKWPLDCDVLRFARREPANVRVLLRQELRFRDGFVFGAFLLASFLSLVGPAFSVSLECHVFLWALYVVGSLIAPRRFASRLPLTNIGLAWWQSRREPERATGLKNTQRDVFISQTRIDDAAPARPNVLFIVCESLSKRVLESPEGRKATPRYQQFIQAEMKDGDLFDFPLALANSSSSDIAYSSLFTGLSPDQSWDRFHQTPLIWDIAKAQGYHTALYTSQSLEWCGLEDFLITPSLDRAVYREVLEAPAVNDLAMDDRVLNRHVIAELPLVKTPFFSVLNYNMLHAPFNHPSGSHSSSSALERYIEMLGLFDACLGEVLDCLATSGQLNNTVIVFTADHGETPERYDHQQARRMALRLDQLDLDNLVVPFWFRIPARILDTSQINAITLNTHQTVSHTDIYPTLLQLWGVDVQTQGRLSTGKSLIRPLSEGRGFAMHNTSAFRQWACEPFAVARNHWLLIYHDLTRHFELYNLLEPTAGDYWGSLKVESKAAWLAELAGFPLAVDILSRRKLIKPPPPIGEVEAQYDRLAQNKGAELHELNNWGLFSLSDWHELCHSTACFIGLQDGDRIFEAGCGSGAFLDSLRAGWDIEVDGLDLSAELIKVAKARIEGSFWIGDIQDLACAPANHYDKVVSNAVFLYLPNQNACERAALEMIRLTKPGGLVYVGLLNDPERMAHYQSEHRPSGNAFLRRNFWHELGARQGLEIETVDQDRIYCKQDGYDAHARLRYSVRIRKPL